MPVRHITLTPEQREEAEQARQAREAEWAQTERERERDNEYPPPGTALARLRAAPRFQHRFRKEQA